jgi:hypothetical protein
VKTAWIALVGMFAVLIVACGGDGESSSRSLTDDDLRQMVLITSGGLPWEITTQTDRIRSNEDAAADFLDPEKWLQNYQQWGRTGGHVATFSVTGSETTSLQTEVEAYSSSDGATDALTALRAFLASDEAKATFEAQGFTGVKIDEAGVVHVGDESAAYRFEVVADNQALDTFIVLFRRDAVLATASLGAPTGEISMDELDAVAKELDARIQDILNE